MFSLVGLASYDSDRSDIDEATGGDDEKQSAASDASEDEGGVTGGAVGDGVAEPLEENSASRLGESSTEEGLTYRDVEASNVRSSPVDVPAPSMKESRQFFMPLPSPLVRHDNASSNSPFRLHELNDGLTGTEPDSVDDEQGGNIEGDEEGDQDIINPEFRDMLPPETTGQANPELQAKIAKCLATVQGDYTKTIKSKKDYGNPAVLAQICRYFNVDDKGTNYPADRMVHPSVYDTKDFHDSLMAEFRRAKRLEEKKPQAPAIPPSAPPAAPPAAHMRPSTMAAGVRTASESVAQSSSATIAPSTGSSTTSSTSTSTRGSKWGDAAPASTSLSGMAVAAAAAAAAATAAAAAAAAAGQKAMLPGQTQAPHAHVAKEAQQRAEAIAKQQMMNRLEKVKQEQAMRDQPPKKARLS